MPGEKITHNEASFRETSEDHSGSQLAYTTEAKDFIAAHPGSLKIVIELIKQIEQTGVPEVSSDDINVDFFEERDFSRMYAVEIDGQKFFVKVMPYPTRDAAGGFQEFKESHRAKELLKDLPEAEVIEYQLGYRGKERSYFVAKWNESAFAMNLEDYLDDLSQEIFDQRLEDSESEQVKELEAESEYIANIYKEIKSRLSSYYDMDDQNMAYDKERKKVIVFDLNTTSFQQLEHEG